MQKTAILHATLIDGNGGQPLADSAVLICGDKIEAAGRASDITVPEDAAVIDATGKFLIPGLIEGHGGVGGYEGIYTLQESVKWGITSVVTVSGGEDGVRLRNAIARGYIKDCAKLIVGGVVCSTGGHLKKDPVDGPWEIRRAVRKYAELEVDFIKTAASLGVWEEKEKLTARNYTPEELEALADEARAWDLKSVVHAHTDPGLTNAIHARIDQIHHGQWISREHIDKMKEYGLFYMPILKITSVRNVNSWDSRPWMRERLAKAAPVHRQGLQYAAQQGIKLMVGSIYPGPADRWECGEGTSFEMMEMCDCGLSPMEVLVAATRNNAEGYGKLQSIGTVESGKQADLVLLRKSPLEDIAVLHERENISAVWCDGRMVYRG